MFILSVLFLHLIVNYLKVVRGLRDVQITMPKAVQRTETAVLQCDFDLEGDQLYSLKWYKGRREFFRFTPNEEPKIKLFPLHGTQVVETASNLTHLVLKNVQFNTAGKYSCEISADAPSFHTALVTGHLTIIDLPRDYPIINGIRSKYRIGDIIDGLCVCRNSRPAANLTWFINDHPAFKDYLGTQKKTVSPSNSGYETSMFDIQFVLSKRHFINGQLRIRCTANIYDIYWRTAEKLLELEHHHSPTATTTPTASSTLPSLSQSRRHHNSTKKSKHFKVIASGGVFATGTRTIQSQIFAFGLILLMASF